MCNRIENTSNSETIAPSSLECDDYDRESCLHVRNIRVFLDNSNGEKLSEQLKGGTDLNQRLNEIVKRITVDTITENKLTLKFFLDEDPEGSSDLISPISAPLQTKEKEIDKEIFSNNNLFSFGSGDEAPCKTQKILQEFNTSVFISVSTQTDNNFCSKETQCDIIGDKKILGDNSESQKHDEKIILNFCKHNCCSVPDTSAKLQRLISFYLVQDEAVFSKCIVREIGTQTEDIELSVNIGSISQLFDGPLAISKSHVNVENGGWIVARNESLKIKEYFDRKGFDKVLEDSIIFKNIGSKDGSKDEDQDRYSSFGFSPDSEVDEVFHAENTEEEKVSLYFESRLEQRKGEAKSKRYKEPPQSSFEKTTSRAIKNRFLEDEPDFEVLPPIEELNFHNAYIVKKSYPVDSAKITLSSPPRQTESSVEVLTLCFSKLRSRRICPTLKLPIYFSHFLRSKLFKIQSPQRASVNPVLLTEIILQYPANPSLESFELKKESTMRCVCLEVLRQAGLKRQAMIQRKFNSEEENINDFTQYEEEESCCFNTNTAPSIMFYRKFGVMPPNKSRTGLPLCDSCFELVQKTVEANIKNDNSNESSNNCSSKIKFGSELNLLEESHFENKESTPEDKDMIVLSLAKRLKDDFMEEHCILVNNYLLNMGSSDPNELKTSVKFLRRQWLKEVSNRKANTEVISFLMSYFQAFSDNLLKMMVYTTDITGNNVLHFAFSNNRFDIAELFLTNGYAKDLLTMKNKAGHTAFMVCSISNPRTETDWFIVYKALRQVDLNQASNSNGQTPLMNAARYGSDLMVKLLTDAGANPNIQDIDGSTALMYAAEYGHEKCAELLLSNPLCDPNIKDNDEETACSIALAAGHKDVALLIYLKTKNRSTLCSRIDSLNNSKNAEKCRKILRTMSLNHFF